MLSGCFNRTGFRALIPTVSMARTCMKVKKMSWARTSWETITFHFYCKRAPTEMMRRGPVLFSVISFLKATVRSVAIKRCPPITCLRQTSQRMALFLDSIISRNRRMTISTVIYWRLVKKKMIISKRWHNSCHTTSDATLIRRTKQERQRKYLHRREYPLKKTLTESWRHQRAVQNSKVSTWKSVMGLRMPY